MFVTVQYPFLFSSRWAAADGKQLVRGVVGDRGGDGSFGRRGADDGAESAAGQVLRRAQVKQNNGAKKKPRRRSGLDQSKNPIRQDQTRTDFTQESWSSLKSTARLLFEAFVWTRWNSEVV